MTLLTALSIELDGYYRTISTVLRLYVLVMPAAPQIAVVADDSVELFRFWFHQRARTSELPLPWLPTDPSLSCGSPSCHPWVVLLLAVVLVRRLVLVLARAAHYLAQVLSTVS